MKLLIISHTKHYRDSTGIVKGWGPTVREINFLSTYFSEIVHLSSLHSGKIPESCIAYNNSSIHFIPLPPSGGKKISDKIKSILLIPQIIIKVNKEVKKADAIQLRIPTGIANYLLPFLTLKKSKPLTWVKYAGNWKQEKAPLGYRFQRWWLLKNFMQSKVTINGAWNDQPAHCFTFENPCLDAHERIEGRISVSQKKYVPPYTAIFIGRIEKEKGVERIINAFPDFANQKITTIHFVGEGPDKSYFEAECKKQSIVNFVFHGSVSREHLPELLSQAHFLLLPSTASEGFPKVIAEGANYGVIPIVSDISSIGQYVNESNGYVWNRNTDFSSFIKNLNFNERDLKAKSINGYKMAELFTFENYIVKLKSMIFNDH